MNPFDKPILKPLAMALTGIISLAGSAAGQATEPCGDFDECKVLIEINASDGDIGFHFLVDGSKLEAVALRAPKSNGNGIGQKLFSYSVKGPLKDQTMTETFAESDEPLCFDPTFDDDADNDDEDFVTLVDFLERWMFGTYTFRARNADQEKLQSATQLTNLIPAAPTEVDFDPDTGVISWEAGDDLGACSDPDYGLESDFEMLLADGDIELVTQPDAWEVVLEPDFDMESDDDDERDLATLYNHLKFTTRVAGDTPLPGAITVPEEFLADLPSNTPVKIEVGAIAGEDNATFTEEDGYCVNEDDGEESYCED